MRKGKKGGVEKKKREFLPLSEKGVLWVKAVGKKKGKSGSRREKGRVANGLQRGCCFRQLRSHQKKEKKKTWVVFGGDKKKGGKDSLVVPVKRGGKEKGGRFKYKGKDSLVKDSGVKKGRGDAWASVTGYQEEVGSGSHEGGGDRRNEGSHLLKKGGRASSLMRGPLVEKKNEARRSRCSPGKEEKGDCRGKRGGKGGKKRGGSQSSAEKGGRKRLSFRARGKRGNVVSGKKGGASPEKGRIKREKLCAKGGSSCATLWGKSRGEKRREVSGRRVKKGGKAVRVFKRKGKTTRSRALPKGKKRVSNWSWTQKNENAHNKGEGRRRGKVRGVG